jgi:hypothetical protein
MSMTADTKTKVLKKAKTTSPVKSKENDDGKAEV